MKSRILLIIALLLIVGGRANAQTPTATATATATAPAAASTVSQFKSGITHFGYLSADAANLDVFGGYKVNLTATAALLLGQVVKPDTANASSVVVSTSGTIDPIGVVIGAAKCVSSACSSCATPLGGLGVAPCAGQPAIIQVSGISVVPCERALTPGTVVMSSTLVNGDVGTYVAGTVDEQIGVLLTSCTTNGPANILLYK